MTKDEIKIALTSGIRENAECYSRKNETGISERLAWFRDRGVSADTWLADATSQREAAQNIRDINSDLTHDILVAYKSGAITKSEAVQLACDLSNWHISAWNCLLSITEWN